MRGRLGFLRFDAAGTGTTPAYAGKTACPIVRPRLNGDHPRVCGEDEVNAPLRGVKKGPPPRMRGRPLDQLVGNLGERTTPAYAGKTGDL